MSTAPVAMRRGTPVLARLVIAAILGVMLYVAAILAWVVGYQLLYAGRIFPGVSVAGVDVSGLAPEQAALRLSQTLSYPISGKVVLRDGDRAWSASPAQLGMVFDASSSAQSAYRVGRAGGLFAALGGQIRGAGFGYDLAPVIIFDQRVAFQYLQGLAAQIDKPVIEAGLEIDGTEVRTRNGQSGRALNIDATLVYVSAQLQSFRDGEIPMIVQGFEPAIVDISAQSEIARTVLGQPIVLRLPNAEADDAGPWVYDTPVVANLIGVEPLTAGGQPGLQVILKPDELRRLLKAIQPEINRQAKSSRFHFDEGSRQLIALTPSVSGRRLDIEASIRSINEAVIGGQHNVTVVVEETQPAVPQTATAAELGITELLPNGIQTTYFRGSDSARVQNIKTAAASYDGVLVAPGETFSMGEALGDVSLDNGFTEALIIYGGRTIKGVGGGVCQVSTTLFRTVFFAGFPVVQRVPHAYRVSYYEQTSGGHDANFAGMDATVYFPLVDFKFTNNSAYWILMETQATDSSLTWRLYSTYDGRSVQWETSGVQNIVPAPKPEFRLNPDLKPGQITQVDYAANGADVNVRRTVLRDGSPFFQDSFQTHYEAWQAVCEYARGMADPEKTASRKQPPLCQPPSF